MFVANEDLIRDQRGRRNESVKMTTDDLLNDDVGTFLLYHLGIEIVLPQIHARLKCSDRNGTRRETNESRKITARAAVKIQEFL